MQGHIAIATAVFPQGVGGAHIDALARRALWQVGLDYDHGTGHGVGSYLSVHEGPVSISRLARPVPIAAGMILSNEPGFYLPDHYGIRLENLLLVQPAELPDANTPVPAVRDADAGPLRPPSARSVADDAGGNRLARRLSRARAGGGRTGSGGGRSGLAGRGVCAAGVNGPPVMVGAGRIRVKIRAGGAAPSPRRGRRRPIIHDFLSVSTASLSRICRRLCHANRATRLVGNTVRRSHLGCSVCSDGRTT